MKVTPYRQYNNEKDLPENYDIDSTELNDSYVWQFISSKDGYTSYSPVNYYSEFLDNLAPHLPRFDLKKIELFPSDKEKEVGYKKNETNKLDDLLNQYFYDALSVYYGEKVGGRIGFKYYSFLIPAEIIEDISNIIEKYKLKEYGDFIFLIIAKIQQLYVSEISYYQEDQPQKELLKFPKETEELIKAIDDSGHYYKRSKPSDNDKPVELKRIIFNFDNHDNQNPQKYSLEIKDYLLIRHIVEGIVHIDDRIIREWETESYLGWKEYMRSLSNVIYSPLHIKNKFKHNTAKALYEFFMNEVKLNSADSLEIIVKILRLSLIELKERDSENTPADIEMVRKWVERT
jgi:hypothetical protein